MTIKKGMRFEHKRFLSTEKFDGKTPQVFEVTKVAQSAVYYRPVYVYRDGDATREQLGSAMWMDLDKFEGKAVGKWLGAADGGAS